MGGKDCLKVDRPSVLNYSVLGHIITYTLSNVACWQL